MLSIHIPLLGLAVLIFRFFVTTFSVVFLGCIVAFVFRPPLRIPGVIQVTIESRFVE